MKKTALTLGMLLLCSIASARKYSYATWTFEMPENAVESRQDGIYGYKAGNVSYLFTPPAPMNGRTPAQIAQAVINDVVGNQAKEVKALPEVTPQGGTRLSTFQVVTMTQAGTQVQVFMIFSRDDQWGLLLTTLPAGSESAGLSRAFEAAGDVMTSVNFHPPAQAKQAAVSPTLASALPSVAWPAPRADRVVLNSAKITYPAARKLGLNPYQDLLPDTFDCYRINDERETPLRPMNATPDGRVTIATNGTYSFTAGNGVQSGTWQKTGTGSNRKIMLNGALRGVTSENNIYLNASNDLGQGFQALRSGVGELLCLQQGPHADALRVQMARARVGNESFTCTEKGGQPYPLKLTDETYSTPRGNGRLRGGFRLNNRGDVNTVLTFTGGPYDSNDASISEDDFGNRTLDIQYSVVEGNAFASETTTRLVARCTAKTAPKPFALYGPAKAPAGNKKGGPDGFYVGYRQYSTFNGMIPMTSYALQLSYFTPNGYFIDDAEPDETGVLPDCTRTRPNGEPFCQRYEIKGKTIRTQDTDGDWNSPDAFAMTKDTLDMDGTTLYRVTPLQSMPAGVFTSDKVSASGMPGSAVSGNISSYANAYQFSGGQFAWRSDSSSSTTVGNAGYQPGILASAGSSRTDAGSGKYTLSGYWLTLNFSDGRVKRLFTYPRPAALAKADSSMTQELNIGGTWLNRAK